MKRRFPESEIMQSRRHFLKSSILIPAAMAGSPMLSMLNPATAYGMDSSGYRALVCVFLFGGMDCHDTVLPYDLASYNSYSQIRSSLLAAYQGTPGGSSRARAALLPLNPSTAQFGSRQFALPPQLAGIHQLFEGGNAAVIGNVGPLKEPTSTATFSNNQAMLPPRLFSHNDQQSTWMSFAPEGSQLGWGGRFGDAAAAAGGNINNTFSQVSLAGNTVFLNGDHVSTYNMGTDGVPSIGLIDFAGSSFSPALQALARDHFSSQNSIRENLFERDFINISRVSLDANDTLDSALSSGPSIASAFPASPLGAQLRAVAETIALRDTLGASRQVFFVGLGGFDTHSSQANDLPGLQQDIGDSIAAFYAATQELGVADEVTTFTAADFGRTLTVNGDGTDHGWGSHHFVVGGAVRGGDIYGNLPVSELGHDRDAGNGRLIPDVSVEQYSAPLGRWFGLNESELSAALPGLASFPAGPLNYI
jgi:uncharacterized protein (DUF1501 family)